MTEEKKYAKLSELDGQTFTVNEAYGYVYKKWDEASKRMLMEENWNESMRGDKAWRKIYAVNTSEGKLDLSEPQLKNLLIATYKNGIANIVGVSFAVKKVIGLNDIPNYYFNVAKQAPPAQTENTSDEWGEEPINIEDVPL